MASIKKVTSHLDAAQRQIEVLRRLDPDSEVLQSSRVCMQRSTSSPGSSGQIASRNAARKVSRRSGAGLGRR